MEESDKNIITDYNDWVEAPQDYKKDFLVTLVDDTLGIDRVTDVTFSGDGDTQAVISHEIPVVDEDTDDVNWSIDSFCFLIDKYGWVITYDPYIKDQSQENIILDAVFEKSAIGEVITSLNDARDQLSNLKNELRIQGLQEIKRKEVKDILFKKK